MIIVPKSFNYISAFLTFGCNLNCSYCINKQGGLVHYASMPASDWIEGLRGIETDLPITISGGEPTTHPNFYEIVNGVEKPMDLLTNGEWDIKYFIRHTSCRTFKRVAPYASIRFSYHPGVTNLFKLLRKAGALQKRGYYVGVWAVAHPDHIADVLFARKIAERDFGIDFRIKEYLGYHKDKLYGTYKYPDMVKSRDRTVLCKPSELLIAPNGNLYRCHQHLYSGHNSYGNILDKTVKVPGGFVKCDTKEGCNLCDLKQKFDRYQKEGHCAVEIKEI